MKTQPNTNQKLVLRTLFTPFFLLICLWFQTAALAQGGSLYLLTSEGGKQNLGTISRYNPTQQSLTSVYDFQKNSTSGPGKNNGFIQAADGKLYGLSSDALIRFDPQTGTSYQLHDFTSATGSSPCGSLVQAQDGLLYGLTTGGGSGNAGVLFAFDPVREQYKELVAFAGLNGANPRSGLLLASDGKLYGTTAQGGMYGQGVLFSFEPAVKNFTLVYEWSGPDGSTPSGGLVQLPDGQLAGMTSAGGSANQGVVYYCNPTTRAYTKILDFEGNNGAHPGGNLLLAGNGKLYGLSPYGGAHQNGVLFSIDPATALFHKLFDFGGTPGSGLPFGSLAEGENGILYGTVAAPERPFPYGSLFAFDTRNQSFSILHQFQASEGIYLYGNVLPAANGKLYGMTGAGGSTFCCLSSKGAGGIFSYDLATRQLATPIHFNTGALGFTGSLSRGPGGLLYGFSTAGGSYRDPGNIKGTGTLFSFDPVKGTTEKLADYPANNAMPVGALVPARNGLLYGVTLTGGNHGQGAIYSFDPGTRSFQIRHHFGEGGGTYPQAGMTEGSDGKLYGTTTYGGSTNSGTLFRYDPKSGAFEQLAEFTDTNGAFPMGNLMQAPDGRWYGLSNFGGNHGYGTLYCFNPATHTLTALHHFTGTGGSFAYGGLTLGQDGLLYGLTSGGGTQGGGILFSFSTATRTFEQLFDFAPNTGIAPKGNLLAAADGLLYGVTSGGGLSGKGVLFAFQPKTKTYNRLQDFTGTNGASPVYTSLVSVAECAPATVKIPDLYVLPQGVEKNTVYPGYAPAAAINLSVPGFSGEGYRYEWSTGATTANILVAPKTQTTYSVNITDAAGCTYTAAKEIKVLDVRCGAQMNQVLVCNARNKAKTACIQVAAVADKLARGFQLGSCAGTALVTGLQVSASPNPTATHFTLHINDTEEGGKIMVRILDMYGRVMEQFMVNKSGTIQVGARYQPGIYIAQVYQGGTKNEIRLVKTGR